MNDTTTRVTSLRTLRRRSRTGVALAMALPLLGGAALMGAGLSTVQGAAGETLLAQGTYVAPAEVAAPAADDDPVSLPTQLFPVGPGEYTTAQKASGDLAIPTAELEDQLASWQLVPDQGNVSCTGTASVSAPGQYATCELTDGDGAATTYYAYAARMAGDGGDYRVYYAQGSPLSTAGAAALNDGENAVAVYPVYDETDAVMPVELGRDHAIADANAVLAGEGVSGYEIVSVDGSVDLTSAQPVAATARDLSTGEEVTAALLPVVLDGEGPALTVSIDMS